MLYLATQLEAITQATTWCGICHLYASIALLSPAGCLRHSADPVCFWRSAHYLCLHQCFSSQDYSLPGSHQSAMAACRCVPWTVHSFLKIALCVANAGLAAGAFIVALTLFVVSENRQKWLCGLLSVTSAFRSSLFTAA